MTRSGLMILFFLFVTNSFGQTTTEETYCIKLNKPSSAKYFDEVKLDSIPTELRDLYTGQLLSWGKLLSRFNEEPLISSSRDIFRSVTFGHINDPGGAQIMRIERLDNKVEVTIKFIKKLKDSTVLVHRKTLGIEAWQKFEALADQYFIRQPSIKRTQSPVLDGGTTVFEGYLSNRYHFLERQAISLTEPGLQEINSYLFRTAGPMFDVNCKKDTRSK